MLAAALGELATDGDGRADDDADDDDDDAEAEADAAEDDGVATLASLASVAGADAIVSETAASLTAPASLAPGSGAEREHPATAMAAKVQSKMRVMIEAPKIVADAKSGASDGPAGTLVHHIIDAWARYRRHYRLVAKWISLASIRTVRPVADKCLKKGEIVTTFVVC